MSVKAPATFNGELFMKKFEISEKEFSMYKGELYCEKLPNLTEDDIADCVDTENPSEQAVISFVEKWGSINTYPDGNDSQQAIFAICEQLEKNSLLLRSNKRIVGMVIFFKK